MSWNPAPDPSCPETDTIEAVDTVIIPKSRDIGGFEVRRVLPASRRRMVGPFIFFDQMGPAQFAEGGIDVRPHPHIGLATVTYLFTGELQHRDSLGFNQLIQPGELNWMVAGRGITHSERTRAETRSQPHELFGIQTWVALPDDAEDSEPGFEHHGKSALPTLDGDGKRARLLLGAAYGKTAPVRTFSEMFYLDVLLDAGARLPLPDHYEDRALYIVSGEVCAAGRDFGAGQMLVFSRGARAAPVAGEQGARCILLGGETFPGPRYIWWNFVASSRDRIESAKEAWRSGDFTSGRFKLPPEDADEYIPLPD